MCLPPRCRAAVFPSLPFHFWYQYRTVENNLFLSVQAANAKLTRHFQLTTSHSHNHKATTMIRSSNTTTRRRHVWWLLAATILGLALHSSFASAAEDEQEESEEQQRTGTIIGIDLGTTYSCVGAFQPGLNKVEIIPNDQGNRITPSYVAFVSNDHVDGSNGERLVGDSAKNQATLNPEHTIFDVKRLIGRKFHDDMVQQDMKLLPYTIANKDNRPYVVIRYEETEHAYAPEEISAMVLSKLKADAEKYLGKPIDRAVVTVHPGASA